jgi:hypothetical protein
MSNWKIRSLKWCVHLATGGTTFGILQGFGMINWANMLTSVLITWLSVLAVVLLGGNAADLLGTGIGA